MGGHVGCLVIDNALEEIYFFDPNGKSNYFNYSFYNNITDSDKFVNLLFEKYFSELGTKYKFVSNYDKYVLNVFLSNNLNYQVSEKGNCMIISLIICHYLMLTQKTLFDTIKDFYELSDNEFIDIISLYTVGLYELFQI